jgi:lipoprotein-releasing system permease protein
MNVKWGDNLVVITTDGNSFRMKVSGILKTGLMSIDDQQSYVNITTAQKMTHASASYITEIKLKLYDKSLASNIREKYENLYDYHGSDFQKDNAVFIQGESMRSVLSYSISITLLLVAGFGIYNILTMMIYDKMKEIAILKATGFSDKDVRWIFLTLSLVIGAIGAMVGLASGFLMAYGISKIPYHVDIIILMDHLPVSFNPAYYVTGFIFGIATTTMASFFPSRKAAKVDPITILRG